MPSQDTCGDVQAAPTAPKVPRRGKEKARHRIIGRCGVPGPHLARRLERRPNPPRRAPGREPSSSGKTSKALGASLSVKLTYPGAPQGSQANIKQVKVDQPRLFRLQRRGSVPEPDHGAGALRDHERPCGGQNGWVIHQNTLISVTGCPKAKAKKKARHATRKRRQ